MMNLQQAFEKVKNIRQDNHLLEGEYSEERQEEWEKFNKDCRTALHSLFLDIAVNGPDAPADEEYEGLTAYNFSWNDDIAAPNIVDLDEILSRSSPYVWMGEDDFRAAYDQIYQGMKNIGLEDDGIENIVIVLTGDQLSPYDIKQLAEEAAMDPQDVYDVINEQFMVNETEIFLEDTVKDNVYDLYEAENTYLNLLNKHPEKALPTGKHAAYNMWRIKHLEQMAKLFGGNRKESYLQRLNNLKESINRAGNENSIMQKVPADVVRGIDHCRKDVFREMIAHRLVREIHALFSSRQPSQVGAILSDIKITALLKAQEETGRSTPEQEEQNYSR